MFDTVLFQKVWELLEENRSQVKLNDVFEDQIMRCRNAKSRNPMISMMLKDSPSVAPASTPPTIPRAM